MKTQRHDAWVTSQPPTSGPITNAMPVQAVQAPIAAPRSSPLNVVAITASPAGVSIAPATPWSPRARISVVPSGAAAQRIDVEPEADDPDQEQPARAEEVAERAADEEQRAERQQVRVDDPLLEREPAAEVVLDRRQRDVDDRRVDEDDDRAEDAGDEDEPVAATRVAQVFDTRRPKGGGGGTKEVRWRLPDRQARGRRRLARRLPRRDARHHLRDRRRAGCADAPADAAAHGQQGLIRPPAQDAGGDLLRAQRQAPVQARTTRSSRSASTRRSACRRRPGAASGTTSRRTRSS